MTTREMLTGVVWNWPVRTFFRRSPLTGISCRVLSFESSSSSTSLGGCSVVKALYCTGRSVAM